MAQNSVDLAQVFGTVTKTLAQNQRALNQADGVNQDHGTNMVQTFQTITSALQAKQGKSTKTALNYAAQQLAKSTTSSSGKLYAKGLAQAATQVKGSTLDQRGAMQILQTMLGGGQAPQAGGDLLGSLLGGMAGGQPSAAQPSGGDLLGSLLGGTAGGGQPASAQQPGGDLLGSLLGGMAGGQSSAAQPSGGDLLGSLLGGTTGGSGSSQGLDMGDLLNAGMAFMQAKQSGGSTMEALIQAFMSASGMGNSKHRTQSTSLVVNSFLQAMGSVQANR